jgi:hypothetical protein
MPPMRLPAVLAILIVLTSACSAGTTPTRPSPSPSPSVTASPSTEDTWSPPPSPVPHQVQYVVDESNGTAGSISYTGADFRTVYLSETPTPWRLTVTIGLRSGDLVSVDATGATDVAGASPDDTVSCRLLVDGRQVASDRTTMFVGNDLKQAACGYNVP